MTVQITNYAKQPTTMGVPSSNVILLLIVFAIVVPSSQSVDISDVDGSLDEVMEFLEEYNSTAEMVYFESSSASWAYYTNLTDYNQEKSVEASLKASAFSKNSAMRAREFDDVKDSFPEDVQRILGFIADIGVSALDNDTVQEYNEIMGQMNRIYSSTQVCRPDDPSDCLNLEPGLAKIMATSTDWDELVWAWQEFRNSVGRPNKPLYADYVDIANQGARANGYEDLGDSWRSGYGDDLETQVYELYNAILPLYKQLHAYVRRKLNGIYGSDHVPLTGHLPANVLGDMWGRFWTNIYPHVVPYPDLPNIDVSDEMVRQNYTVDKMFNMADEFFSSMGLYPANNAFWNHSMFERPDDGRDVVCHASAWDFSNRVDFRIKMCTEVNMDYFLTVHHELGHIQYYLNYKHQPVSFRGGANGAFHEAIGELMSQSVATPKHLKVVGLFDGEDDAMAVTNTDINFLLKMALPTIGTLPFSLALEQWRWDVFSGKTDVNAGTARWWQLKNDLIGVKAPVERTEEDFEAGAMYHIIISYPFIGYYIRTIIQFQFYQSLCQSAGHTGPLHKCDFYDSKEAGDKLAAMLSMGSSRPWPEAMEALTGQREMKADAILEYFQPLMEWLENINEENEDVIGWDGPMMTTQESTTAGGPSALGGSSVLMICFFALISKLI
ncbi:angiotensin-converting enzyme-like [Lytechinus pictus]|uniref:angiotensin-converting enzyme-like n=1 Tax=Lytechinus pictus TaxID=7653 RepID=UPI0030B9D543